MNMYICTKINYINSPFIKFKAMASLCNHYFIGYAGLPCRTTGISGLWASICTILFPNNISFITSAVEIIVCQNPGAIHESMLSDVHIGEKIPLHNNGVTIFTIHVVNVMFRHSNN